MSTSHLPKLMICDDDSLFQLNLKRMLKDQFECKSAYHGDEALAILKNEAVDLLILDIHMRSPREGLQFIPKLLSIDPDLAIIMSSASVDFRDVKEALKLGAVDYVVKSSDPEELVHTVSQVLERKHLIQRQQQQDFETLNSQKQHAFVGETIAIRNLKKSIEKIKNGSANVVITGETGTGKEVIARQLRRTILGNSLAPFVAVDSSTIQSSMAESILFGHEKGAFTGADKLTKGIFEEANGGIVYFDEISNMPLSIQSKLLRVIQEKEITRLGSSKVIRLDFRVVCATNRDLEEMVKKGEFKSDLFQRLNVIPIQLPPLRERAEDIPLLVEHFLSKQTFRNDPIHFTPEALSVLKKYPWPGNIRELGNLIAYVVTMTEGSEIDVADLPPKFRDIARAHSGTPENVSSADAGNASFYQKVFQFEGDLLSTAYHSHNGNITQLALALGMDRSHLYTKLKEHGLHGKKKSSPR
jgi:two-component system nitrogen regulation response regulator NtrX